MILEGLVTTTNPDGSPNVAPMGPIVNRELTSLRLRPFVTSRTWTNLSRTRMGVLHITDDVELLARAAIDVWREPPAVTHCAEANGWRLADCCRWFAFRVDTIDDRRERIELDCSVVASGRVRDFFGFNRAKHAVLEAAILATRIGILPADAIRADFDRLAVIVQKTAGDQEERAFALLHEYVLARLAT